MQRKFQLFKDLVWVISQPNLFSTVLPLFGKVCFRMRIIFEMYLRDAHYNHSSLKYNTNQQLQCFLF